MSWLWSWLCPSRKCIDNNSKSEETHRDVTQWSREIDTSTVNWVVLAHVPGRPWSWKLARNTTITLSREAVAMESGEPEGDSMSTVNRNSKQKLEFVIKSTWEIVIKSKWNIVVEC